MVLHCARNKKMAEILLGHGADPRTRNSYGEAAYESWIRGYVWRPWRAAELAAIHSTLAAWTPHQMLPSWTPSSEVFGMYSDHCPGFRDGIRTLLLCLARYRHMIRRDVGMEIVAYIAAEHRRETCWPIVDFDMAPYIEVEDEPWW